ncbi:hypothetical protein BJV77DRAFT_721787 [Russula vinacea]|nr:hypothetical protein BJV77DRAFT_721787 [Russula vinacea]
MANSTIRPRRWQSLPRYNCTNSLCIHYLLQEEDEQAILRDTCRICSNKLRLAFTPQTGLSAGPLKIFGLSRVCPSHTHTRTFRNYWEAKASITRTLFIVIKRTTIPLLNFDVFSDRKITRSRVRQNLAPTDLVPILLYHKKEIDCKKRFNWNACWNAKEKC